MEVEPSDPEMIPYKVTGGLESRLLSTYCRDGADY